MFIIKGKLFNLKYFNRLLLRIFLFRQCGMVLKKDFRRFPNSVIFALIFSNLLFTPSCLQGVSDRGKNT